MSTCMNVTNSNYNAEIDQVTEPEWSDLLPRFDDASVYQSWSYGAVCWGKRQLSHLVLKREDAVVAMAQVRIVRLPVLGKGIAYVRWGPLWRLHGEPLDEEVLRQVTSALKAEYVERRRLLLRIVPNVYAGDAASEAWQSNANGIGLRIDPGVHVYRTMRLDLSKSLDDLRKGLHQRWRNYLKNAEKSNYAILEGANVALYDQFLVLYREMMTRKRFETTVDVDEFRRLQQALPDHLKMRVFVCEQEGQVLNALVISAAGDSAIYLLAATGEKGLKERGAYLLQWRAIQWLKERGCRWYDVGGINPDRNPGVYQFKTGLGGQEFQQAGGYQLGGDWVNTLLVSCGECLRSLFRAYKSRPSRVQTPSIS